MFTNFHAGTPENSKNQKQSQWGGTRAVWFRLGHENTCRIWKGNIRKRERTSGKRNHLICLLKLFQIMITALSGGVWRGGATTCGWQDAAATWAEYNCSRDPSHTPSWQQQTTSLVLGSFRESGAIFDARHNNSTWHLHPRVAPCRSRKTSPSRGWRSRSRPSCRTRRRLLRCSSSAEISRMRGMINSKYLQFILPTQEQGTRHL